MVQTATLGLPDFQCSFSTILINMPVILFDAEKPCTATDRGNQELWGV